MHLSEHFLLQEMSCVLVDYASLLELSFDLSQLLFRLLDIQQGFGVEKISCDLLGIRDIAFSIEGRLFV